MTGETDLGPENDASEDLCIKAVNGTHVDFFHMNSNFGGIPEILATDFLVFLGLLLVFFFIRKGGYKLLIGPRCLFQNWRDPGDGDTNNPKDLEQENPTVLERLRGGLGCLAYDEKKMLATAGHGAVQYLRFQMYLIGFLGLVSVLSLCVILPINLQGQIHRNASSPSAPYAQTVFDNLDSR